MSSILEKTTYNIYLSSTDKISRTNNNAIYDINFDDVLPRKYNNYKMMWSLSTIGWFYKDSVDFSTTTNYFNVTMPNNIPTGSTQITLTSTRGIYAGIAIVTTFILQSGTIVVSVLSETDILINKPTINNYVGPSGVLSFQKPPAGATILGLSSVTGVRVGMMITGAYIPSNTYVTSVYASSKLVAISNATTNLILSNSQIKFIGNIYAGAKVFINFSGASYSFETSNKCASNCVGYITRDPQGTTTSSNTLSCFYAQNCPKTINRPNQNQINIKIYNSLFSTQLFVDSDSLGNALTDCTAYNLTMEFFPIEDSLNLY